MQDAVAVRLLLGGSALFRDRLVEAVDYAEEALAFCEVRSFMIFIVYVNVDMSPFYDVDGICKCGYECVYICAFL